MTVQPIDRQQRETVLSATGECLRRLAVLCEREFPLIEVRFDLSGRAAGMYRVRRGCRLIRYNPYIFAKYFDDSLQQTVPHEVAHYVTDMLYGLHRVRPHGPEWRTLMRALGADPRATARYDLDGIPVRRQRRFLYQCACPRGHSLSARRHNAVCRGEVRYHCRCCGAPLVRTDAQSGLA